MTSTTENYLSNKVALVTGANRGIGKAIVNSFIEHGASKVYLAVRDPNSTDELEQQYGEKVVTLQTDVGDDNAVEELANQAKDVDIVVNNAGVLEVANPLSDNIMESFQHELNINAFGLIRIARAFSPVLEKKKGALVQLNSVASIKNFTDFSSYSASKAAAYSITQGLRDTLAPKGVNVLSVHPGPILTDMATKAGFDSGDSVATVSEGIVQALNSSDFHLFPDAMAKDFEQAYASYADSIINAQ